MSQRARILTPVLLAMVVLSGCFGCEDPTMDTAAPNIVLFVPPDPITLNVGDSKTVTTTVLPFGSGGQVTDLGRTVYTSSDTTVATVDPSSGKVTCVSAGTVKITATNTNSAGAGTATLTVTCTLPAPPPVTGAILLVSPASLPFTHTVGTTTCPQNIGSLHVSTERNETVNVTLAVSGTSALNLGQTAVTLPPAGAADVGVNFNCSTQTNFTATIVLNATSATTSGNVSVPVTSNIK